jgi:hypothetical protein
MSWSQRGEWLRWVAVVSWLGALAACAGGPVRAPRPLVGRVTASWPGSGPPYPFELEPRSTSVRPGETAAELLRREGVVPDADALEVLRALNPGVDVFALVPGASLTLPRLPAEKSVGRPIELRVDDVRKSALAAQIARVEQAWSAARPSASDRQDAAIVDAADDVVIRLSAVKGRLARRSLVTTGEFLDVLTIEARSAEAIASGLGRQATGAADRERLARLAADLRAQTQSFVDEHKGDRPTSASGITVEVRTKRQLRDGASDVSGYRVWYLPMLDYRDTGDGLPFGGLSPVRVDMPPGLYALWATRDADPMRRLGVVKSILILPSATREIKQIDLVVDPGAAGADR